MTSSTSAIKKRITPKTGYLLLAEGMAVAVIVYHLCSNGRSSFIMALAFLPPVFGAVVCAIEEKKTRPMTAFGEILLFALVLALSLAALFQGIIEIYGTKDDTMTWAFRLIIALLFIGFIIGLFIRKKPETSKPDIL